MPTYEMTVFRWSGNGYNSEYNESYTATFSDDDSTVGGSSDANETVSIDGGTSGATYGSPYKIEVSFTDADGNDHVEDFNFFYTTDGGWYFAPEKDSEFTEGATLGSYQSHSVGWSYDEVICFAAGTHIMTDGGELPVEALKSGAQIQVQDGSYRTLRMNIRRDLDADALRDNPKLRPVCMVAGALGSGLPKRDLRVSRQHRMLVNSKIAERMFGRPEALVSAIKLTDLPGIYVDEKATQVSYYHLLFDDHEVVFAEGAPSESLFAGDEALRSLAPEALKEMLILFPDVAVFKGTANPAHHIPSSKGQKKLVERHGRNGQPVLIGK